MTGIGDGDAAATKTGAATVTGVEKSWAGETLSALVTAAEDASVWTTAVDALDIAAPSAAATETVDEPVDVENFLVAAAEFT